MFHTVEQKFDHIDQPQVSLFVCVQTAQRQRKQYGVWERMGSVLKRSSSDRLQIAFPHGRIFCKELESLLCPQLVQNMKELPWNSMTFLHGHT